MSYYVALLLQVMFFMQPFPVICISIVPPSLGFPGLNCNLISVFDVDTGMVVVGDVMLQSERGGQSS